MDEVHSSSFKKRYRISIFRPFASHRFFTNGVHNKKGFCVVHLRDNCDELAMTLFDSVIFTQKKRQKRKNSIALYKCYLKFYCCVFNLNISSCFQNGESLAESDLLTFLMHIYLRKHSKLS